MSSAAHFTSLSCHISVPMQLVRPLLTLPPQHPSKPGGMWSLNSLAWVWNPPQVSFFCLKKETVQM